MIGRIGSSAKGRLRIEGIGVLGRKRRRDHDGDVRTLEVRT